METDSILLERWRRQRDPEAFSEIVRRHASMVFNACVRVLHNSLYAEEIAQDCFVELLDSKVQCASTIGGWLHTVAVRRAIDRLRSETRRTERELLYAKAQVTATELSWDELTPVVDEAICELPSEIREVIIARFLRAKTHEETATELGIAVSTVQLRSKKGIELLRSAITTKGFVASAGAFALLMESIPAHAIPAALTEQLGKLTLAAAATSAAATSIGTPPIWGGVTFAKVLLMKKPFFVAVGLVAAIFATWWVGGGQTATNEVPTRNEHPDRTTSSPAKKVAIATVSTFSTTAPVVEQELPEDKTTDTAPLGSVSGVVIDSEGKRLPGWTVSASTANAADLETQSAEDGSFTFDSLRAGSYGLTARLDLKIAALRNKTIQLREGEKIRGIELVWEKGTSIWGQVRDPSGAPIESVNVRGSWTAEDGSIGIAETKTDGTGYYVLEGLRDGDNALCNLQVQKNETFIDAWIEDLPVNTEQIVTLTPKPRIEGQVIDASTRAPITRFQVLTTTSADRVINNLSGWFRGAEWNDDAQGKFSIHCYGFNRIIVAACANGYRTRVIQLENIAAGEHLHNIEIALDPAPPIRGIVMNENNEPVAGASAGWGYMGKNRMMRASTSAEVSAGDGTFVVSLIPEREDVLSIVHPDYAPAYLRIKPDALPSDPLQVILNKGGTIEGRVIVEGDPDGQLSEKIKSQMSIVLESPDGNPLSDFTEPAKDGRFVIEGVAPGNQIVRVHAAIGNSPQYSRKNIVVQSGKTTQTDLALHYGSCNLQGTVSLNGQPPREGMIFAHLPLSSSNEVMYRAVVKPDGSYQFKLLPEGNYEIKDSYFMASSGETVEIEPITVSVAGELSTHDFDIRP